MPRNWPFALGSKKPLGLELLFEAFERLLQRADSLEFDSEDPQLVLAALLINGKRPMQHNFLAISEEIPVREEFTTKEHATELRVRVLEGKIQMTGALRANIAQLTGNPNLTEIGRASCRER